MKTISPTGKGVRIRDYWGSGLFGAPRGKASHLGLDQICVPGEPAVALITPTEFGPSRPYAEKDYGGIFLANEIFVIELWYVELFAWVLDPKAVIKQGWEIGICQDIRQRISRSTGKPYGDKMIPHLHWQVRLRGENHLLEGQDVYINPEVLM